MTHFDRYEVVMICPFSAFTCIVLVLHSIQLAFFVWPFFLCCLFASSQSYSTASTFVISSILFQFLASQSYIARFSSISSFSTFSLVQASILQFPHYPYYRFYPFCSLQYILFYPNCHLHLLICFSTPGLRYSLPCYQLFVPYAFHFSFSGMRSSFVCLLVSS